MNGEDKVCAWFDDTVEDLTSITCDALATHFSCCESGEAPNVCEKHRCRCRGPVVHGLLDRRQPDVDRTAQDQTRKGNPST